MLDVTNSILVKLADEWTESRNAKLQRGRVSDDAYGIKQIKWLKSEEALRQLIESLKESGLIQTREPEDIIQHFAVFGKETRQAQLEPIKWEIEIRYLAYLIHKLGEEMYVSLKDSKHKLTVSHFVDSNGNKLSINSLASSLSALLKKQRDATVSQIDSIIQELSVN